MMPAYATDQAPVLLPSYHREQAHHRSSLHINALVLVQTLPLLALCR